MPEESKTVPKSMAWMTEGLRVSMLYSTPPVLDLKAAWRAVAGTDSEESAFTHKQQVGFEEGEWQGKRLLLGQQASRVDWLIGPPQAEMADPNLGNLQQLFELLLPKLSEWSRTAPKPGRVAVGASLIARGQDIRSVMEFLDPMFPKLRMRETDSMRYQVNRFVPAADAATIRINRVYTLTAAIIERKLLVPIPNGLKEERIPAFPGAQLEIDVNTPPVNAEITVEFSSVVDELAALALALAEKGEG